MKATASDRNRRSGALEAHRKRTKGRLVCCPVAAAPAVVAFFKSALNYILGAIVEIIQVIDGAENAVYNVFSATESEFSLIFLPNQNVAFTDEVFAQGSVDKLNVALRNIWERHLAKKDVIGIHGLLFYDLAHKKAYYPTRRDEEAVNPDGSRLR